MSFKKSMEQVPKMKFSLYDIVVTNRDLPELPKNSPGVVVHINENSRYYEVEFFPDSTYPRSSVFLLSEDDLTLQKLEE